jgi:hypothetical protein
MTHMDVGNADNAGAIICPCTSSMAKKREALRLPKFLPSIDMMKSVELHLVVTAITV